MSWKWREDIAGRRMEKSHTAESKNVLGRKRGKEVRKELERNGYPGSMDAGMEA